MGWTGQSLEYYTIEEIIKKDIESGNKFELKYYSKKGKVAYTAIKDKKTGEVFASVFLLDIDKKRNEFYYKEVPEYAGPFEYEAPEKLIKMLSQTKDKYALEWRKKCLYKPKKGDKIKFLKPINFINGDTLDEFIFKGYNIFQNGINEYNISKWKSLEYKIVK